MIRSVVFLDIDGVLATLETYRNAGAFRFDVEMHDRQLLCPDRIALLNELTDRTGAAIVVSSSWRHDGEIAPRLRAVGVTGEIIGATPRHVEGNAPCVRGVEIAAWRTEAGHVGPIVILDDEADMGNLKRHLVRTEFGGERQGLQRCHVERAIEILARQDGHSP